MEVCKNGWNDFAKSLLLQPVTPQDCEDGVAIDIEQSGTRRLRNTDIEHDTVSTKLWLKSKNKVDEL